MRNISIILLAALSAACTFLYRLVDRLVIKVDMALIALRRNSGTRDNDDTLAPLEAAWITGPRKNTVR